MKKRLLSAALALAMVLTMIPATMVTALAAEYDEPGTGYTPATLSYEDSKGQQHYFYEDIDGKVTTVRVEYCSASDNTTKREAGHWYFLDNKNDTSTYKYYEVTSGVIVGTGTSGNWYPSLNVFFTSSDRLVSNSFTLLNDQTVSAPQDPKNWPTSLTVDVNGNNLSLGGLLNNGELAQNFSSLTITDRLNPLTNSYTGSVSAIAKDTSNRPYNSGTYTGLTLNMSNITVPSITLAGGANTVTLNNVTVTGGISMDGTTVTTNSANKDTTVYSAQKLNINNNGQANTSTRASVGGDIDIFGDGSALILNNLTSSNDVNVTSNGGSVTVSGATSIGDITVESRKGASATPPSVTINGGSVGTITRSTNDSTQTNSVTINSAGSADSVVTENGKVTVNQGKVRGAVSVGAGTLTLTGPVTVGGTISLPGTGKTTLSITGTGSDITGITAAGPNLTISQWPTGRENYFGTLALGTYSDRGVKGGVFSKSGSSSALETAANAEWFSTDLQFVSDTSSITIANKSSNTLSLYGKNELALAISNITSSSNTSNGATMHILCQQSTYTLTLKNAGIPWANIGFEQATGMILPNMVNGYSVSTWTSGDNDSSVPSGKEEIIPKKDIILHANGVATTVAKAITKAAVSNGNGTVENQDVKVTLNGTNIQISGAIVPAPGSNIATIELDLTTDALNSAYDDNTAAGGAVPGSAMYLVLKGVQVFYNVDTKAVGFSTLQKLDGGAIVNEKGELVLNNGTGTHYTVSANLVQSASNLYIYTGGKEIQATVSGTLASRTQSDKDDIIEQISGTGAEFDINENRAILEAINAAQATVTNKTTVTNWVTTAQNYVWKNGNSYKNATTGQALTVGKGDGSIKPHTGNLSTTGQFEQDGIDIQLLYSNAYIVPYLVVNATGINQNGTVNATLSVYYRVDVSGSSYDEDEYYTVQAGKALSALTGDMATAPVKVKFATAFSSSISSGSYMHQDGKYVYEKDGSGYWSINHAGTNGNGLGTVVINFTEGPISLSSNIVGRAPALISGVTYDDLQAAVDDTVPGAIWTTGTTVGAETMDKIIIGGAYAPTECSITMSGIARKIALQSSGNRKITGTSGTDVQSQDGINYIAQLKQDNVPAGTVAIAVTGATGGTASLSTTSAKAGQTVTVTVSPAAGRTSTGVTIKTNTGSTVTATPTGTANQYSFTVPSGVTSITVTPSFNQTQVQPTKAVVSVASNSLGSTTTTAAVTNNQVDPGSTVGVTTYPTTGYRTMGVNITTNGSSTTASRQGDNYFTFTVPSNATAVSVAPVYDRDNGTKFSDVWSTEYYSDSVAWAVKNKITDGTSTYTFSPSSTCTRGQMVTFLWRAAGSPTVTGVSNPFVDVSPSDYYYSAILWAVSKGITNGVDSTHFGPSQTVTRAQAVTFLYRYEGSPAASTNSGFNDVRSTEYYAKAVSWAANKGITNGTSTYAFSPSAGCQRAQIVTFLYRDVNGIRA